MSNELNSVHFNFNNYVYFNVGIIDMWEFEGINKNRNQSGELIWGQKASNILQTYSILEHVWITITSILCHLKKETTKMLETSQGYCLK